MDAIALRDFNPDERAQVERGHDIVSAYMAAHGVGFPEAVAALAAERRREFVEVAADYAERHGLDDDETRWALLAHCINGPGREQ
jgi:hypothetical protein